MGGGHSPCRFFPEEEEKAREVPALLDALPRPRSYPELLAEGPGGLTAQEGPTSPLGNSPGTGFSLGKGHVHLLCPSCPALVSLGLPKAARCPRSPESGLVPVTLSLCWGQVLSMGRGRVSTGDPEPCWAAVEFEERLRNEV